MGSRSTGGCGSAPGWAPAPRGASAAVAAKASPTASAPAARVGIQIRDTMPPSMLDMSRVYREAAAAPRPAMLDRPGPAAKSIFMRCGRVARRRPPSRERERGALVDPATMAPGSGDLDEPEERHLADAGSARGGDRVGQGGGDGGGRRLADAGRYGVVRVRVGAVRVQARRHDDDVDVLRRLVEAQHRVVVEVVLLDGALLEGDLATEGEAQAIDDAALHLRPDAVHVDGDAAVDRGPDLVDRQLLDVLAFAVLGVGERDVDHHGHVAEEGPVGGDAEAAALHALVLLHLVIPARLLRHPFDHGPQPSSVGGVSRQYLVRSPARIHGERVVVEELDLLGWKVQDLSRPDQLEQVILGIAAGGDRELVGERADAEGVVDVRHRAHPAGADVVLGLAVLDAQVVQFERVVLETMSPLDA